jgi:hypothetical protein
MQFLTDPVKRCRQPRILQDPLPFLLAVGRIQYADCRLLRTNTMPLLLAEVRLRSCLSLKMGTHQSFLPRAWWLRGRNQGRTTRSQGSLCFDSTHVINASQLLLDCVYREAWDAWRDLLKRRLYPIQGYAQQLAYLSPNTTRYQEAWHRWCVPSLHLLASYLKAPLN